MLNLLYVLTPIALLDSTSITPLSIVPMALLLAGRRPYVTVSAFLLGLYVSYLVMALGFLFGLSQVFEQLNTWFTNKLQNPDALDLLLQIGIGLILIFFGARIATKRKQKTGQREAPAPATPAKAFVFAVGLNVVGFPGAVPYFAAADQILRLRLGVPRAVDPARGAQSGSRPARRPALVSSEGILRPLGFADRGGSVARAGFDTGGGRHRVVLRGAVVAGRRLSRSGRLIGEDWPVLPRPRLMSSRQDRYEGLLRWHR